MGRPPLNVLFVHYGDDWIAGSEIALLELLRALSKQDVTPTLWCNSRAMENAAQAIGIPVQRDDFAFYFDQALPVFSPRSYLALVRKAVRLISQTKADLVHCNSAGPTQWMLPACWWKGVPTLVNLHSPYMRRSRYVLGLHLADHIVAVASAVARPLLDDGMEQDRLSVIYNGFDSHALTQGQPAEMDLRSHLRIPPEAAIGVIAGSLIRRKGHDILFEAMKRMDQLNRPFHLLVAGEGPEREFFQATAKGLPVHFLGQRDDLGLILRDHADFLIAPSRQEAFGRVIIEAAFVGIPAIGANIDGIPEAILDTVTGLLVKPESPCELAAAIMRLIEDDELRRDLGKAAQHRAKGIFSIATCAEKMTAAYRATRQRFDTDRCALLTPRRLKPYWTLICGRNDRAR